MSEEHSSKTVWRRIGIALGMILLCGAALLYALLIYMFYVGKEPTHPLSYLTEIAMGFRTVENKFRGLGYEVSSKNPATCDTQDGKGKSLSRCTWLVDRHNFSECSWWRFERCAVLEGEEYLLTRPDLLGPALSAIYDPCRYIPTLSEIGLAFPDNDIFKQDMEVWNEDFDCAPSPENRNAYANRPERVFVKLFDEQGAVVFKTEIKLKR